MISPNPIVNYLNGMFTILTAVSRVALDKQSRLAAIKITLAGMANMQEKLAEMAIVVEGSSAVQVAGGSITVEQIEEARILVNRFIEGTSKALQSASEQGTYDIDDIKSLIGDNT